MMGSQTSISLTLLRPEAIVGELMHGRVVCNTSCYAPLATTQRAHVSVQPDVVEVKGSPASDYCKSEAPESLFQTGRPCVIGEYRLATDRLPKRPTARWRYWRPTPQAGPRRRRCCLDAIRGAAACAPGSRISPGPVDDLIADVTGP